jgi:DNA-binding GntR family transcriptional regulator
MMAVLEGICTRFAAKRATVDQFQAIRDAHEKCRPFMLANDLDGYYSANEGFHEAIYRACGNSAITRQTFTLRDRLQPFRRHQLQGVNRLQQSFAEHEQILGAIERGEPGLAEELTQAHLAVQSSFISNLVMSMPREFIDEGPADVVRKRLSPRLHGEESETAADAMDYAK